ncbi:hypothetical protein [Idiomarina abyssalis]|uniref:hypothetical protein n=1 Tax=Idiomarina abyssalis TaxID=86102 RepID=UPI003A954C86
MARHRVGDSYLSDEEYAGHRSENWKVSLFLVVGIVVGLIVYSQTLTIEIKFIRFGLIIISGIFSGFIAAKFSEVIRTILSIVLCLGVLYAIGALIWNAM